MNGAMLMLATTVAIGELNFVDPLIGTEGSGSEYGGMQPYTCVPFGSFHAVPMTRTNRIGRLSFNSSDGTLLGIILTRQPAIWMGDWGEVRVEVPSAKIEALDAKPHLTRVTAGGRTYEYTATAHAAWIRGLDAATAAAFPVSGINTNRMDAKYGYPLPNFGGRWYADKSRPGELKIGLSLISVEQAKTNLANEIGTRTFDEVVAGTRAQWEEMFSRVEIEAPDDVKTIFYTGLYHTLLYPRQMDECGRYYSAFDDKIHSGTRYNCFSLWDTYRAEHPWLTLVAPERVDGMMQSLVDMYKEGGWLPKWPNPSYTGIMVGAPAEIVLQEARAKGFTGFDWTTAQEAIRKNATVPQEHDTERRWEDRGIFGRAPETRAGLTSYLKRGYVACDETAESVSRTQDFSLADRNRNYTNLWCAAEGLFLPRRADGSFVSRKDLKRPYRDYCEQQPETGVWAVPHDPEGLAELMGGKAEAIRRLDEFFDTIFFKPDGRGNGSIHGNETSHHCAYLYNRFGAPEKTQQRVRQILTKCYSTNRKGFDGNEDCGQMSAWYVFSALGFYPLDPASGAYEIGSPLVKSARIGKLRIRVNGYSPERWRVKSVSFNGQPIADRRIRHEDVAKGGELVFEMCDSGEFERMKFNNPGLIVPAKSRGGLSSNQLFVRDVNGDGRLDVVVNGGWGSQWNGQESWAFLRPLPQADGTEVFAPPVRIGTGAFDDGLKPLDAKGKPLATLRHFRRKVRDVSRQLVDYDGDGTDDLVVCCGDWSLYGWDSAYDARGLWTNSTLHGYVYWHKGLGNGRYADGEVLRLADGNYLDAFGGCAALFADWDRDGDLDLIRVDFTDTILYFENSGTRTRPVWECGRFLRTDEGLRLRPELCMAKAAVADWNGDGFPDIVLSEEDARPAVAYNTGRVENGLPVFRKPQHLLQCADELYLGVLNTPWVCDWDGDGDEDILSGDSAGHVAFIENLSGAGVAQPKWAAPVFLTEPDGREILIQAGVNGSIQGPCEAKWGYTCLSVADWDGDGLPDVMANTIWGRILWWRNVGTRTHPKLDFARGVEVEWTGAQTELAWGWCKPSRSENPKEILTQWRSTPVMTDWDGDGLTDLLLIDTEGLLGFWKRERRDGRLVLLPPTHALVNADGTPIRLTGTWRDGKNGGSGRRKLCLCDWNGDGKTDLVMNGGPNAVVRCQEGFADGKWRFGEPVDVGAGLKIHQHDPQPAACDFDGNGVPDLVMGAEDGYFYLLKNNRRHLSAR